MIVAASGIGVAVDFPVTPGDALLLEGSGAFGNVFGALAALRGLTPAIEDVGIPRLPKSVEQRLRDLEYSSEAGGGSAPVAVSLARDLLSRSALPLPKIFSTEDRGVRLEWISGDKDVSVEIEPSGEIYLHVLDLNTYEDKEAEETSTDNAYLRLANWMY